MYKILLVDDEVWAVESLKATVEWEKYGFQIVGKAYSGNEAMQLIRDLAPDIVFTDIRMPGMNGLELIKNASTQGFNVKFIVASGYAEFTYVQKALTYGALGYILKPYEETDIVNCLNKAKKILDENSSVLKATHVLEDLCSNDESRVNRIFKNGGLEWQPNHFFVMASLGLDPIVFQTGDKALMLKAGVSKWFYIVEERNRQSLIDYLEEKPSPLIRSIALGNCIKSISDIESLIEEVNIAAYSYFTAPGIKIHGIDSQGFSPIKEILHALNDAIKIKNLLLIDEAFSKLDNLFRSNLFAITHAHYAYNVIMSFIYHLVEPSEIYIFSYHELILKFKNVFEMLDFLKSLIIKQLSGEHMFFTNEIKNKNIKSILEYVDCNFQRDITMQSLCQKFFINPNYISQFFKKEVGLNFTEYLAKKRLEYACYLLRQSDLSIQKISESSGYKDYFYFTRIFKKHQGMTPSEYRNMDKT